MCDLYRLLQRQPSDDGRRCYNLTANYCNRNCLRPVSRTPITEDYRPMRAPTLTIVTMDGERIASQHTCDATYCHHISVPTEIAVCPDCFAGLLASPDEIEHAIGNLYKVFTFAIYCLNSDDHGAEMTEDWFDTYDAVGEWFETIFVDYSVCSVYKH
jgi:hypothetical protein